MTGPGPSRRAVLTAVAAAVAVSVPASARSTAQGAAQGAPRSAAPDLAALERRSGGRFGVFALDTGTGATLEWRATDRFPFCSSCKGLLAAFALWQVDRGRLRLDRPVRYGPADLLPWAPVTRAHVATGTMSLEALCAAAVQYSDNTAANLVWRETGGPAALTEWLRSQGDPAFALSHNEPKLNLSRFGDPTDTSTPRAMADSYRRVVLGDALSPESRARLAGWMVGNITGDKRLRAGLPHSWRIGDKTGTWNEGWFSTADIAVAWPPGRAPLVIACLATDTPDTAHAERAMAELGRTVATWTA